MARRHEWNALADERGNDMDVELVDLVSVEKGGNQLAAAHHPNVFSRRGTETSRKCLHRLGHEFDAPCRPFRWLPREHVMRELRVEHPLFLAFLLVIGKNPVVSFAAPQDRVNRGVERVHAVIEFAGSSIQPFDITVWPGDVAVGAGCNVDDDFSMCFHQTLTF